MLPRGGHLTPQHSACCLKGSVQQQALPMHDTFFFKVKAKKATCPKQPNNILRELSSSIIILTYYLKASTIYFQGKNQIV